MTRDRWLGVGLAATAILIVAACSGTGGSAPAPTPAQGLAAATGVVGHSTRTFLTAPEGAKPGEFVCTQVASHSRLSGDIDATYQEADLPSEGHLVWGEVTLTNTGGTGSARGSPCAAPSVSTASRSLSCDGRESHDGPWAYHQQEGDIAEPDGAHAAFSGRIEHRRET